MSSTSGSFQTLKNWKTWQRAWFFAVVFGFLIGGIIFTFTHGNREFHRTDGATEQMLMHASKIYVKDGFMKYWLLPEYPAFGMDNFGNQRTEPFVYTHYFPGPAWVLGAVRTVTEDHYLTVTRLAPLVMNVLGLGMLGIEFAALTASPLLALILMTVLTFPRAITVFSVCLSGHGYVMGMYFIAAAILLRWYNQRKSLPERSNKPLLFGLFVGFFQIWFSIDFISVSFLALLGIMFAVDQYPIKKVKGFFIGMILGGVAGLALQATLFTLHLGSVHAMIEDFVQFGKWRMGAYNFPGEKPEVHTWLKVLHEYNRQAYGATGFTAWNMMAITFAFILMARLGNILSAERFKMSILGLVLAYCGAISWNTLMKQHSMAHTHFLPRHYVVLYVTMFLIVLPIAAELVKRAKAYQRS